MAFHGYDPVLHVWWTFLVMVPIAVLIAAASLGIGPQTSRDGVARDMPRGAIVLATVPLLAMVGLILLLAWVTCALAAEAYDRPAWWGVFWVVAVVSVGILCRWIRLLVVKARGGVGDVESS